MTPESRPLTPASRRLLSLPTWLILVCIVTFSLLFWAGTVIARAVQPIPLVIESPQHRLILDRHEIHAAQVACLARGGQDSGGTWGHGSDPAPDGMADVPHRWGLATAAMLSPHNPDVDQLDWQALSKSEQALLQVSLREQFKRNHDDPIRQSLTLGEEQSRELEKLIAAYQQWLAQGSVVPAISSGWIQDPIESRQITAFLFWTAWAAVAERPGAPLSHPANSPHDPLIGRQPAGQFVICSIVSVIVPIAAIAACLLVYLQQHDPNAVQPVSQRPAVRVASPSQN